MLQYSLCYWMFGCLASVIIVKVRIHLNVTELIEFILINTVITLNINFSKSWLHLSFFFQLSFVIFLFTHILP
jgi:hypothetical protein